MRERELEQMKFNFSDRWSIIKANSSQAAILELGLIANING